MRLTCPHCHTDVEFSGRRPSFCGYCGRSLADTKPDTVDHEAQTLPPDGAPSSRAAAPEQVGGYRLLRPLGAGGMGFVYEAEEVSSGRRVALKLIVTGAATPKEAVERFRQEGRLASQLIHPRCVFVLAADEENGQPYIVMELMPGETLQDVVEQDGPLPPDQAVAKVLDVIEGLQEAHRLGLVHRDVKPSNCFVQADGRVKVGDFGLAKSLAGGSHLTRTGAFLGTPLYASPEQVKAERVDQQSDLYAVAATLYFLLTGKAPHETGDAAATLARIVADPAPSMRTLRPGLSAALDDVVLRGLERQREKRWRDLEEFRQALLPFVPGRLSIAGLGMRFGAYQLDVVGHNVLAALVLLLVSRLLPMSRWSLLLDEVLRLLINMLYFAAPEGLFGWSPGKLLLGLRVRRADGGARPGLPRALWRSTFLVLVLKWGSVASLLVMLPYLPVTYQFMARLYETDFPRWALFSFLPAGALILSAALLWSTMRARNGYRGLHEFVSGTRVVAAPAFRPARRWGGAAEPPLLTPPDLPGQIGAYAVRGALRWTPDDRLLLAEDAALGRRVWLQLRPAEAPGLTAERRKVSRPARLWCLASGRLDGWQWDAFAAPAGRPLPESLRRGTLAWADFRPVLEELTDELAHACADHTLPAVLDADQVWVADSARVQMLDEPLTLPLPPDPAPPRGEGRATKWGRTESGSDEERALQFLAEVSRLALEGRAAGDGEAAAIRAVLPLHAARVLSRLTPGPDRCKSVAEFQAELRASHCRPAEVTRTHRMAHLATLAALSAVGLACVFFAGTVHSLLSACNRFAHIRIGEIALAGLRAGACADFLGTGLQPDPLARSQAVIRLDADEPLMARLGQTVELDRQEHQARLQTMGEGLRRTVVFAENGMERRFAGPHPVGADFREFAEARAKSRTEPAARRVAEVFESVALGLVVAWPAAWVLWAFLTRGGLSYRLLGLALVRRDGRPASRLRCAGRALLVWAPLAGLLMLSIKAETWYWAGWAPSGAPSGLLLLSEALWWSAVALLAGYAALALWRPARSLHDRLLGTCLVPR